MGAMDRESVPSPPYEQVKSRTSGLLDAYRCKVRLCDGKQCPRVELTHNRMMVHLVTEHGIRRVKTKKEREREEP